MPESSSHHGAALALSNASTTATLAAMRSDELAIDRLFAEHRCTHAYLDVGTNIGVQLRKLFEPSKYPKSLVLKLFERSFGAAEERCKVCAFGFEPNPRRRPRLLELMTQLRRAGAPVHVFFGAASDVDGIASFGMGRVTRPGQVDWSASAHPLFHRRFGLANKLHVRSIDLGRILRRVDYNVRDGGGGAWARRPAAQMVMKLDTEGAEYTLLTHLILTQAACLLDVIDVEWHDKFLRQAVKANRTTRVAADGSPALRTDTTGAAAINALTSPNAISGLPALYKKALSGRTPDCRASLLSINDETYLQDGMPWPSGRLCGH